MKRLLVIWMSLYHRVTGLEMLIVKHTGLEFPLLFILSFAVFILMTLINIGMMLQQEMPETFYLYHSDSPFIGRLSTFLPHVNVSAFWTWWTILTYLQQALCSTHIYMHPFHFHWHFLFLPFTLSVSSIFMLIFTPLFSDSNFNY